MAELSGIQPNNLTKIPLDVSTTPTASSGFERVSQQDVAQQVEQKKAGFKQSTPQEVSGQIDAVELDKQMNDLNAQLQKLQNYLKFERDEDSDRMVIFIKDRESDEVIRQIPSQEFLAISKSIGQYLEMSKQVSEKILPPIGLLTNETV
ncbi:flagellin [Thiomicrorhabdus immobilis]|uniref:Flagellin n=1 Tax=Thiomicrorhabdus immobilis TaxID=2791037 RepID=A0ABM7MCA1_9GAMM|nr:flagellar protein FlaG [Thiomicrorhabdus immobilis]BCN92980.1 flagellin [Thiomicrorhabdus immobilis]